MDKLESYYEKLLGVYRNNIVQFVEDAILSPYNKDTESNFFITKQQHEGLTEFQNLVNDKRYGKRHDILGVSIMSGKGTGKDAIASWIILWFMFCFPNPKIPCISVSADQLNKVLWSEINKWLSHSIIKEFFTLQSDKLYRKDIPPDEKGKGWFAFTKAANPKNSIEEQLETLAGQHADYLLQVVDEGSGVSNIVYETLEENMTTPVCNLMFLIFNPMHSKGYAIDTQYSQKHRWVTLRWNSEESEIVNQTLLNEKARKYGKDSNTYRMNVLGLPPVFDNETLVDYKWVLSAINKPLEVLPDTPLVYGVDCGAGGDKSVIASRRGPKVFEFKRKSTRDSVELSNWIGAQIDIELPDVVRIDTIGIGWAIEGNIREKKGAIVEPADVRRTANDPERFENKRAEMYWTLREAFERGEISIPDDNDLLEQLAAIQYKISKRGKIVLKEKSDIKSQIGHSPDECDALAITYFNTDKISKKHALNERPERRNGTWMSG